MRLALPLSSLAEPVLTASRPHPAADFGFVHILWVYSGRRGIHAWISDAAALSLTDEQRSAIVRYIDIVKGYTAMDKRLTTIKPMHPSIKCVGVPPRSSSSSSSRPEGPVRGEGSTP